MQRTIYSPFSGVVAGSTRPVFTQQDVEAIASSIGVTLDDGVLSPYEKSTVFVVKVNELFALSDDLVETAAFINVSSTALSTARTNLQNYLNGLTPVWNDLTQSTTIDRTNLNGLINTFTGELANLQRVIISATRTRFRGDYLGTTEYFPGDIVNYQGNGFGRIGTGPTTGTLPTNGTFWAIFAEKGTNGLSGVDGVDGTDGTLVEFVWRRALNRPDTPTGNGIPTGWFDDPPDGTDPLWMSVSRQQINGVLITAWALPVRHNGPKGDQGPAVVVNKSGEFTFVDGILSPAVQTVTFTATLENVAGTINWTTNPNVKSGTGASFALTPAEIGANRTVIVTATVGSFSGSSSISKFADPNADITSGKIAAGVSGQTAWATWPGLTPTILEQNLATASADSAASKIDLQNIASDGKLTVGEKISVRERRDNIAIEYPVWRDRAIDFGVGQAIRDSYNLSFTNLNNYLTAIDVNLNTVSNIVRADFVAGFVNYADARERVIEAISIIASQRANWGNVTGTGRPEDNADVTSGKVAAGITGQGPAATDPRGLNSLYAPSANLIYDGGLRMLGQGWNFGSVWSVIDGQFGEGFYASNNLSGTNVALSPRFRIQGGRTVFLSLDMFAGGVSAGNFVSDIEWLNSSDVIIGQSARIFATLGSAWQRYNSGPLVAPAGTTRAIVRVFTEGATNNNAAFRRVKVCEVANSPFSDEATFGARYQNGVTIDTLQPGELGANVTEGRVASAVLNQGGLATRNNIGWVGDILGRPGFLTNTLLVDGEERVQASFIRNGGQSSYLSDRWPQEGGANITENRVASAFAGQTAWATLGVATGRVSRIQDDGFIQDNTVYRPGIGPLDNFWPQEAGANVTEGRVAASISGQGPAATDPRGLNPLYRPAANLVYDAGLTLFGQGWNFGSWSVNQGAFAEGYFASIGISGTNQATSPTFPMAVGKELFLSIEMFAGGVSAGSLAADIEWLNSSDGLVGYSARIIATNGAGWTRYNSAGLTSPAGTAKARVRVFTENATNTNSAFRRVKVSEVFDAPFSDDATYGARYLGGGTIDTLKPGELGANVTEGRVASAVLNQGGLATRNNIGWVGDILGKPEYITNTVIGDGVERIGSFYVRDASNNSYLADRWPQEFGSNKTETRIANAVSGQGPWATLTTPVAQLVRPRPNVFPWPYPPMDGRSATEIGWVNAHAYSGLEAMFGLYSQGLDGAVYLHRRLSGGAAVTTYPYYDIGWGPGQICSVGLNGYGGGAGVTFSPYIEFLNAAKNSVLASSNLVYDPVTDRWQTHGVTAPANTVFVRIVCRTTFPSATTYQDSVFWGIKIERNERATAISENSTSFTSGDRIEWNNGLSLNNLRPAELGSNVTENRVASSISGQTAWATLGVATGRVSRIQDDGFLQGNTVYLPGVSFLNEVWPGEYGANVTEGRVAASIAGQGDLATANRSSLPFGSNTVVNSNFARGTFGWSSNAAIHDVNLNASYSGQRNVMYIRELGTALGTGHRDVSPAAIWNGSPLENAKFYALPVIAGDRVFNTILAAPHRCDFILYTLFFDAAGTLLFAPSITGGTQGGAQNGDPSNFGLLTLTQTAPANARWAIPMYRLQGTSQNDPYIFFTEPMFGKMPANQTVAPAYVPGAADPKADVTSFVTGSTSHVVEFNSDGSAKSGQLPRTSTYNLVIKGAIQTSGVVWGVSVRSGSGTASISGSGAGLLSINSLPSNTVFRISATHEGTTSVMDVQVNRSVDAPPPASGGGTSQTDTSFQIWGSSYAQVSDELVVNAGSVGSVDLSASFNFDSKSQQSSIATEVKFQKFNGSSWVDIGGTKVSNPNCEKSFESEFGLWITTQLGVVNHTFTDTAPSANQTGLRYRLMATSNGLGNCTASNANATATGK